MFFAGLLLRLSRIKRSQDISMGKFGPTALNFYYVFFLLLVRFLGTPCKQCSFWKTYSILGLVCVCVREFVRVLGFVRAT